MDNHNFIRVRDRSMHTFHSIDHVHLYFYIALNNQFSHEISKLHLKREFKCLTDKVTNDIQIEEIGVVSNEHESSKKIKECTALMKTNHGTFFTLAHQVIAYLLDYALWF